MPDSQAESAGGAVTTNEMSRTRTVGILIFPDVEILDFCGPFEVFASATLASEDAGQPEMRLFEVFTLAERLEVIHCRGGLLVQPSYSLADHPPLDLLVIPGGYGTRREQQNPVVLGWIARQREQGALTTSVCTGAFLLAAAGLLDGLRATTHWSTLDELRGQFPNANIRDDERVVDEGEIVTAAGVSAGIDMALHIVRRLHGDEIAHRTARDMEYRWDADARPLTRHERAE
jgi:transcriptional regulator GlxA family with amidase domain